MITPKLFDTMTDDLPDFEMSDTETKMITPKEEPADKEKKTDDMGDMQIHPVETMTDGTIPDMDPEGLGDVWGPLAAPETIIPPETKLIDPPV